MLKLHLTEGRNFIASGTEDCVIFCCSSIKHSSSSHMHQHGGITDRPPDPCLYSVSIIWIFDANLDPGLHSLKTLLLPWFYTDYLNYSKDISYGMSLMPQNGFLSRQNVFESYSPLVKKTMLVVNLSYNPKVSVYDKLKNPEHNYLTSREWDSEINFSYK